MTPLTLILIICILLIIHLWIKHKLSYWKRNGVVSVKGKYLLGNMKRNKHLAELSTDVYNKLKRKDSIGGFYFLLRPTLLVFEPDLIKNILVKDFQYFHDRGIYHNEKDDPLWTNLFTIEGQQWKTLRKKISPTFTSGKLKLMFEIMLKVGEELEKFVSKSVDKEKPLEIKELSSRFSTDIIGTCAFGIECNSFKDPNAKFRKMTQKFTDLSLPKIIKFFFTNAFGDLSRALGIRFIDPKLSDFFINTLSDTIEYRDKKHVKRNDLLNTLLEIRKTGRTKTDEEFGNKDIVVGKLTFNEVCAQAFVFFMGGSETSANTLTFSIYELSKNVEVQETLREEIQRVLKRHNDQITYNALMEMQYLERVILETLRLHPPIESLPRMTKQDYEVPGTTHVIKKGILVLIPIYAIHRDPEYFPQPEKFDPDRFLEENIQSRPQYTFLPFGEGPRVCIGERFAMLQIKLALVFLLQKYKIGLDKKSEKPIKINHKSPLVVPKNNILVNFKRI